SPRASLKHPVSSRDPRTACRPLPSDAQQRERSTSPGARPTRTLRSIHFREPVAHSPFQTRNILVRRTHRLPPEYSRKLETGRELHSTAQTINVRHQRCSSTLTMQCHSRRKGRRKPDYTEQHRGTTLNQRDFPSPVHRRPPVPHELGAHCIGFIPRRLSNMERTSSGT